MSQKALEDLQYIADRLSGILSLAPTLTTYENLTNQVEELTHLASEKKEELTALQAERDSVSKDIESAKSYVTALKEEAEASKKDILSKAQADASAMKARAEAEVSQFHSEQERILQEEKDAIAVVRTQLDAVRAEVQAASQLKERIRAEIAAIKISL